MNGSSPDAAHHVHKGPFRSGAVKSSLGRRRALVGGAWVAGLALGVADVAVAQQGDARFVTPRAVVSRVDPLPLTDAPGTPVERVSLLAGGERLCALARSPAGYHEVVCRPMGTASERGDVRETARAWRSEELTQLAVAGVVSRTADDIVATGVQRDGSVVAFRRETERAQVVPMPPTGSHGRIVEAYYVSGSFSTGSGCDSGSSAWAEWIVRTEDGAFLMPGAEGQWATVLDARSYRTGILDIGTMVYLRASDRRVVTQQIPWPSGDFGLPLRSGPARPIAALAGFEAVEFARLGSTLCARNRAGVIRCTSPYASPRTVIVQGPPGGAVAMAMGPYDLCAKARNGAWWCVNGPSVEAPGPFIYSAIALRPSAPLQDAREIAFERETGCARWDSGELRCWGAAARGAALLSRATATEVTDLHDVTSLAVGVRHACAIVNQGAWCWGGDPNEWLGEWMPRRAARPIPLRAHGPVRALTIFANDTALAIGGDVWRVMRTGRLQAVGLRAAGATGDVDSIALCEEGGCATLSSGEVWCWAGGWHMDPSGIVRERAMEGHRSLASTGSRICSVPYGGAPFRCRGFPYGAVFEEAMWPGGLTLSRDAAAISVRCAIGRDDVIRCRESGTRYSLGALRREIGAPIAVDETREESFPVETSPCVLGSSGRVACARPDTHAFTLVPDVSDAVQVGGGAGFGCALRRDGRVLCWGANHGGALNVAEVDRAPLLVPFTR